MNTSRSCLALFSLIAACGGAPELETDDRAVTRFVRPPETCAADSAEGKTGPLQFSAVDPSASVDETEEVVTEGVQTQRFDLTSEDVEACKKKCQDTKYSCGLTYDYVTLCFPTITFCKCWNNVDDVEEPCSKAMWDKGGRHLVSQAYKCLGSPVVCGRK